MGNRGRGSQYMGEEYPGLRKPPIHRQEKNNPEKNNPDQSSTGKTAQDKVPVNLNTASLKEIGDLPLIGDYRAKDIIDKRPYKNWDDLAKVPGLTKEMIDAMKDGRAVIE